MSKEKLFANKIAREKKHYFSRFVYLFFIFSLFGVAVGTEFSIFSHFISIYFCFQFLEQIFLVFSFYASVHFSFYIFHRVLAFQQSVEHEKKKKVDTREKNVNPNFHSVNRILF